MMHGCLAAKIFCGYIFYDTDTLIKRHTYDGYIWASVALYLDVINLFTGLLTVFTTAAKTEILMMEFMSIVFSWVLSRC
ncbi:hypothetical protein Hanom_Chr14g01329711 [Helianthus anomalus]